MGLQCRLLYQLIHFSLKLNFKWPIFKVSMLIWMGKESINNLGEMTHHFKNIWEYWDDDADMSPTLSNRQSNCITKSKCREVSRVKRVFKLINWRDITHVFFFHFDGLLFFRKYLTVNWSINNIDFTQNDIDLMKDMGMDFYRFSISWSRIFPSKL